jgi:AraC family transcriptional regulator of arabinose operon
MSYSALRKRNRGAYTMPFSGVGMEFFPLGVLPDQSGVVLHEAGFLAKNDWWNFPNALSPFWRLYYNSRPGHKIVFQETEYELDSGHIVLIPDHQLFHAHGDGPVPHCWMAFQVARRLHPTQEIPIRLRPGPLERQLLQRLCHYFTGVGTGNREGVLHTSLALLHMLLVHPDIRWQPKRPPDSMHRALKRIETEFASALSVPDLARMAGLSVRGFAKTFKQLQGVTPGRFLSQVRVRESACLLANTPLSIEEIAERAGFANRHYFSRVFKRITGDSPAHFRRKHGEDIARSIGVK